MSAWPESLPYPSRITGFEGELIHSTIRTPLAAGYVQTRPRFTRDIEGFMWGFAALTRDQLDTFLDFVKEVKGGANSFSWDDPSQSPPGSFTVRFRDDRIKYRMISPTLFMVTFGLEEV